MCFIFFLAFYSFDHHLQYLSLEYWLESIVRGLTVLTSHTIDGVFLVALKGPISEITHDPLLFGVEQGMF